MAQKLAEQKENQAQNVAQLQDKLNRQLEAHNINLSVSISKDENGNYSMFFAAKNGGMLENDELLSELNKFKGNVLAKMEGKDLALAMGMLKQDGLSSKEFLKIEKMNGEIDIFEKNARELLEKSEFVLANEPEAAQVGGGAGSAEKGRRAYLITQQQWNELWRSVKASQFIAANAYLDKEVQQHIRKNIEQSRKDYGVSSKVSVSHAALMAPQAHRENGKHVIATGVYAGNKNTAKGIVTTEVSEKAYSEFKSRTTEKALNLVVNAKGVNPILNDKGDIIGYAYSYTRGGETREIELVDSEGRINKKGLRMMLWLKRTGGADARTKGYTDADAKANMDSEFISKFRNIIASDSLFKEMYRSSNEAYRKKFGKGRRLSRGGYAAAVGYAVLTSPNFVMDLSSVNTRSKKDKNVPNV